MRLTKLDKWFIDIIKILAGLTIGGLMGSFLYSVVSLSEFFVMMSLGGLVVFVKRVMDIEDRIGDLREQLNSNQHTLVTRHDLDQVYQYVCSMQEKIERLERKRANA